MTIIKHITDLIAERDRLQEEVNRLNKDRVNLLPPHIVRVVIQASNPEEAAQTARFLVGSRNITVVLEVLSADVAEENKRLAAELAKAEARVKTLQTNLLGIAGLGAVYANEED
jgi:hypothetical protein